MQNAKARLKQRIAGMQASWKSLSTTHSSVVRRNEYFSHGYASTWRSLAAANPTLAPTDDGVSGSCGSFQQYYYCSDNVTASLKTQTEENCRSLCEGKNQDGCCFHYSLDGSCAFMSGGSTIYTNSGDSKRLYNYATSCVAAAPAPTSMHRSDALLHSFLDDWRARVPIPELNEYDRRSPCAAVRSTKILATHLP